MNDQERAKRQEDIRQAAERAKAFGVKRGDRVRATSCPGTKRWFTFECWGQGNAMVSKTNREYSPRSVDRVNDKSVDFNVTSKGW